MKKKLLITLCAIMTLPAMAQLELNGVIYKLHSPSEGKPYAEVTPNGFGHSNYSGDIVILSSVTDNDIDYPVTTIGERAFYGCSRLTSITIPNSVTTIGKVV